MVVIVLQLHSVLLCTLYYSTYSVLLLSIYQREEELNICGWCQTEEEMFRELYSIYSGSHTHHARLLLTGA